MTMEAEIGRSNRGNFELRIAIAKRAITQKEIARAIGIHPSRLSKIIRAALHHVREIDAASRGFWVSHSINSFPARGVSGDLKPSFRADQRLRQSSALKRRFQVRSFKVGQYSDI